MNLTNSEDPVQLSGSSNNASTENTLRKVYEIDIGVSSVHDSHGSGSDKNRESSKKEEKEEERRRRRIRLRKSGSNIFLFKSKYSSLVILFQNKFIFYYTYSYYYYVAIWKIFSLKSRIIKSDKRTDADLALTVNRAGIPDVHSLSEPHSLDSGGVPVMIITSDSSSQQKPPVTINTTTTEAGATQNGTPLKNVKFIKKTVDQVPESPDQLQSIADPMAQTEFREDFKSPRRDRDRVTLKFVDGKPDILPFDTIEMEHLNSVKQTMEKIEELSILISPRNASPVKAMPPSTIKPSFSKAPSPSKKLVGGSPKVSTLKPPDGFPKIDMQELCNVYPLAVLHL